MVLQEGATVLTESRKELIEASVVKLHGKSVKLYCMFYVSLKLFLESLA